MNRSTLTYMMVLAGVSCAASVALAANVVVPKEKCAAAWKLASPHGDAIAGGATVPVVLNFTIVDANKGGKVDKGEFKTACKAGQVQADEATVADMK